MLVMQKFWMNALKQDWILSRKKLSFYAAMLPIFSKIPVDEFLLLLNLSLTQGFSR